MSLRNPRNFMEEALQEEKLRLAGVVPQARQRWGEVVVVFLAVLIGGLVLTSYLGLPVYWWRIGGFGFAALGLVLGFWIRARILRGEALRKAEALQAQAELDEMDLQVQIAKAKAAGRIGRKNG